MTRFYTLIVLGLASLCSGCAAVVVGGAAGGAALAVDRRQPDIVATDQRLEFNINDKAERKAGPDGHVNVTSYNRHVLLTGEVSTQQIKQDITEIAANSTDVRKVANELAVGPPSSFESRSRDTYITGQVKARMASAQKFNPLHVKVVTELAVVYLMGLVTEKEGADAADIAARTDGVRRVVKVFEYIEPPAK
jgi:osmotically-inducible protein OsmY